MRRIPLHYGEAGAWVGLRELSGREEAAVSGTRTLDAIHLLDGVVVETGGATVPGGTTAALATADRDRLLAAVYLDAYGPRIESTVGCPACGAPFDLDFELEALMAALGVAHPAETPAGGDPGAPALPDGTRLRLPTGEDELAVAALPPDEAMETLLRRCLDGGDGEAGDPPSPAAVEDAMASAAPVVDADVDGRCPECGENATFRFDLQRYVLAALVRERERLAEEIHILASAYGWNLADILGLPRDRRRALIRLAAGRREPRPEGRPA